MKFVYPGIDTVFDTEMDKVNTLVIENQRLLAEVVNDLMIQTEGFEGKAVVSEADNVLVTSKNMELLSGFFPFTINKKPLLTKATAVLIQYALENDYERMMEMLTGLETFLLDQAMGLTGDISFHKISLESVVKAIGMSFEEDYDSLGEKVIDYFELVHEYDKKKLFVLLNLRSFIDDDEAERFFDTIIKQQYHVLLIESSEHTHLVNEKSYIIDKDLCEISC